MLTGIQTSSANVDANVILTGGDIDAELTILDGMINADLLLVGGMAFEANVGNVTSPGYAFDGNVSTGLYMPTSNTIGFTTAGVERMRLDANGITTTTGNVIANRGILGANTTANTNVLAISTGSEDATNGILSLSSKYSWGYPGGSGTGTTLVMRGQYKSDFGGETTLGRIGAYKESTFNYTDSYVAFHTNRDQDRSIGSSALVTEKMRITSVGNVGIGTTTPASLLHVAGPIQTDTGVVMAMNTSTISGGHSVLIHPMACAAYTASAPGVSTGLGTFQSVTTPDVQYSTYYIGSGLIYSFWRTYVNLVAGTYLFRLHHTKSTDRGIVSIVLNGSTVGTIDTYNGSLVDVATEVTGIVIGSTGTFKLELQMNSKNASSAAYYFLWKSASFVRTA